MNKWFKNNTPSFLYILNLGFKWVGVLYTVYAIVNTFIDWEPLKQLLLICIGSAVLLTIIYVYIQKHQIEVTLSPKLNMKVYFGDLFSSKESKDTRIVIPVNDFFDTQVDDEIIASKSLHGKFIQRYFTDEANIRLLRKQIDEALSDVEGVIVEKRADGLPNKRYPLGTCAKINHLGVTYFLVALTSFDDQNCAQLSPDEYLNVVNKLYKYIDKNHQGHDVAIPLLGAGMARLKKTNIQLLYHLTTAAFFSTELNMKGKLKVVLYEGDKSWANLSLLKAHLKKISRF